GLPRPWDQQWSLRIQQILAFETDLLEHGDLFAGSHVVEARTAALVEAADAELTEILDLGGAFAAVGEMKRRLVASQSARVRAVEAGELTVVGVNRFHASEASPLGGGEDILRVDPGVEASLVADVEQWRAARDQAAVDRALDTLRRAAAGTTNMMEPTLALARAGGTTGEWAGALRQVWGEYRAPTGITAAASAPAGDMSEVRAKVVDMAAAHGGPPRLLVAKPGLDGHSNGAEQIAVAARDAGFEVIYQGIRQTPEQIPAVARDEDVYLVGLSILSGSHLGLVMDIVARLRAAGVTVPVVVGGIIPPADAAVLAAAGVAAVYTPKDFRLTQIMDDLADLLDAPSLSAPGTTATGGRAGR
ncbi:MAG: methylmalonyl-CoA mutase family protein, partial [Acidimicrobiales bacterium]